MTIIRKFIFQLVCIVFLTHAFLPHLHHEQMKGNYDCQEHRNPTSIWDFLKIGFHLDISLKYENSKLQYDVKKVDLIEKQIFTFPTFLKKISNYPNKIISKTDENVTSLHYLQFIKNAIPLKAPPF